MLPSRSGEIVVAGNGPGLRGIPDRFLLSRPLFSLNIFHIHHPVVPAYWTAWDSWSLAEALPAMHPTTRVFLNDRLREPYRNTQVEKLSKVTWWNNFSKIEGVPSNRKTGLVFQTSLHAAVFLAAKMCFEQIYVVGFDCTQGPLHDNPHFYDPDKPAVYNEAWDIEMGLIAEHFRASTQILNLSAVTQAVHLERADWTFYI